MSWGECVENECGQRAQHKSVNNREGVRKRLNPRGGHCTYAARIKYITYIIRAHIYGRCTHYYIISYYIYIHTVARQLGSVVYIVITRIGRPFRNRIGLEKRIRLVFQWFDYSTSLYTCCTDSIVPGCMYMENRFACAQSFVWWVANYYIM